MKTSNTLKLLYEYDDNFFSYDKIENDLWLDLINNAKKEFNVYFDLENNYSLKKQRLIKFYMSDKRQVKFKCELYEAGGDWEIPVLYFKCQIIEGHCFEDKSFYTNSHFIYIPGKTTGNYQLVKNNDKWCTPNADDYKKDIDPKSNEKDCWESLKKYLKDLIYLQIEKNSMEN